MCIPQRRSCRVLIPTIAVTIALTHPIASLSIPIRRQSLPSTPSPKATSSVTKIQATKIQITKIQVAGSTLIPAAEIAQIVAPYENRSLTLAELRPLTEQLTQYYLDRGYLTSRAVLVDQTLNDQTLNDQTLSTGGDPIHIRILEGELESIEVQGNRKVKTSYIRDRLALAQRKPLRTTDLEHQLRLLKLDPLFSQVEASLKEGTSLGKSILRVRVLENPIWSGKISIDNDGFWCPMRDRSLGARTCGTSSTNCP
jgi:hemolysin activation/secretion protein